MERQSTERAGWPRLLRIDPRVPLAAAAVVVASAWTLVITIDLLDLGGICERLSLPVWFHLVDAAIEESVELLAAACLLAVALAFVCDLRRGRVPLPGAAEPGEG